MSLLRKKLGEAMRPRQNPDIGDPSSEIDRRYEKADEIMARFAPEDYPATAQEPEPPPPVRRKPRPIVKKPIIRHTFSMLKDDLERIEALRERAHGGNYHMTKSEIVRAGSIALELLPPSKFFSVMEQIEQIQQGRPMQRKTGEEKPDGTDTEQQK